MENLKFECTDSDCSQYAAKLFDTRWSYIELRKYGDQIVVCHAEVDLADYSPDDIWSYCSGYYDSFEDMIEKYGFHEALQIMAECIFEQLDLAEMALSTPHETEEEAVSYIQNWTQGRGEASAGVKK